MWWTKDECTKRKKCKWYFFFEFSIWYIVHYQFCCQMRSSDFGSRWLSWAIHELLHFAMVFVCFESILVLILCIIFVSCLLIVLAVYCRWGCLFMSCLFDPDETGRRVRRSVYFSLFYIFFSGRYFRLSVNNIQYFKLIFDWWIIGFFTLLLFFSFFSLLLKRKWTFVMIECARNSKVKIQITLTKRETPFVL